MKRGVFIPRPVGVALLALGLLPVACARVPREDVSAPASAERAVLVWPPAPAMPRIAWEGSVTHPRDLGVRSGLWTRARGLLFGAPGDDLERPQGLAVVGDRLFIADPGRARVVVLNRRRKRFTALPASPERPWELPVSVAGLADGSAFVVDAVGRLFRMTPPYRVAERVPWPVLVRPVAVAVDEPRQLVFVLDGGSHQLHRGTLAGAYEASYGAHGVGPGEFNYPTHLCVMPDGTLLVTDAMNFRIQRLSPRGEVLGLFGQAGDGTGRFAKPKGVAVDSEGTIYVVDALHGVVQLFDAAGRYLMHFGAPGRHEGEFWLPTGIAVDATDHIYVADSYNHRVQVFRRVRETAA